VTSTFQRRINQSRIWIGCVNENGYYLYGYTLPTLSKQDVVRDKGYDYGILLNSEKILFIKGKKVVIDKISLNSFSK
jgi:hypothetical protein